MQDFTPEGVSTFCDVAASFLDSFEEGVLAHLSDDARATVEFLIELDADCRNEHEALALILHDAKALRRLLIEDHDFDAHTLSARAAKATASKVEALIAGSRGNIVTFRPKQPQ
jgi:hypothetical protein